MSLPLLSYLIPLCGSFSKKGEILVPEKVRAIKLFCTKVSDCKQNLWDLVGSPMTAI